MTFTGEAAGLPTHPVLSQEEQEAIILRTAAVIGVPATLLAAIRIAEAGGPGREFGVLEDGCSTYEQQAAECARSIRNAQYRYVETLDGAWPVSRADDQMTDSFVAFMGRRYAPAGPDEPANDPTGLNVNWVRNVIRAYRASGIA